jgi:2-hydroxychromene-2-carboxylate isomerase
MFDFNRDGELSTFERAAEFAFLNDMLSEEEAEEQMTELELSGLNVEELEFMDEDERREALEEAGLDPDEYDF